jgi:phosphoheptose isomerase
MTAAGDTVALVRLRLGESAQVQQRLGALLAHDVAAAAELFADTVAAGGTIFLCGNGGSAADAQHIATELTGRFVEDRRPLAAVALTTDTSALTAIGNDYGYEHVFARQVQALGRPGDLLCAISTSGDSANVLAAVDAARECGMRTIGLTGRGGGRLAAVSDVAVVVPSDTTARIQEAHIAVGHILCEAMEQRVFGRQLQQVERRAGVVPLDVLEDLRDGWRKRDATVVWTNGCFDLLHVGHLQSLEAARALGDVLVVGLNDDASVRRLKGPKRPIVPLAERAALLAGLWCVDAVVPFGEDTPSAILDRVRPDVACKGEDYIGKPLPEREVVEAYGGRIAYLPFVPHRSTSALVGAIHAQEDVDA